MDTDKKRLSFFRSFNVLFYFSKILGTLPFDLLFYYRKKVLQLSLIGNVYCFIAMILFLTEYHFVISATFFNGILKDIGK